MSIPDDETTTYASKNFRLEGETHDAYAMERYAQFAAHLPENPKRVLDVGANDGSGGTVLKQNQPAIELYGLDCVES